MRKSTVLILTATALLAGFVLGQRSPAKPAPVERNRVEAFDPTAPRSVRITRSGDGAIPQGEYRVSTAFVNGHSEQRGPGVPNPVCVEFGGGSGFTLAPVE